MLRLKGLIADHQRGLRKHPLFGLIAASNSVEPIAHLARAAAWWPMVFQDVLRLNVQHVRGTIFERFAEFHKKEDAGHDRWYLDDLRVLGMDPPDLDELFSERFQPARDACYSLIAEVYRPQSGAERIALLLALEPTGHVFFAEISAAVDRICPDLPLRYFARSHLGVEKAHDLFTESTDAALQAIVLSDVERAQAEKMVDRIYRTFHDVFSYLADNLSAGVRSRSQIQGLDIPDAKTRMAQNVRRA